MDVICWNKFFINKNYLRQTSVPVVCICIYNLDLNVSIIDWKIPFGSTGLVKQL